MIKIKTDKEIELMRKAGEITKNTLLEVEKYIKPGVTTMFLDKIAYDFIKKNKLNGHIHFLGKSSDMPALYRKAKAIVISSEFEGFGRCMPEAMSYGCIVIGHNTGGTKEQFDNGIALTNREIGFRYNDREKLVSSLLVVHNLQDDDYLSMQHLAFGVVRKLYSVDNYVKSVLDFYRFIKERQEI